MFDFIKPEPNVSRFVNTIKRQEIPERPPFIEQHIDLEHMKKIAEVFDRKWVDFGYDKSYEQRKMFWNNIIAINYNLGYDYIRIPVALDFPLTKFRPTKDTHSTVTSRGTRNWADEGSGAISTWEEFEKYPWPDVNAFDMWDYEYVQNNLPDGMGIILCSSRGTFGLAYNTLLGFENMSYMMFDNPELLKAVIDKAGQIITDFYKSTLGLKGLISFWQPDDMGYKTGPLVSPDFYREYTLPWHKKVAQLAHDNDLLYLLHCCGNVETIMEDLINDVKIDAYHSFEEAATSVKEFKRKYGSRIGVLGGVDIDLLARLEEDKLREYIRDILEYCMPNGGYCLGSGNSIANYVPLRNYEIMLEEGWNWGR